MQSVLSELAKSIQHPLGFAGFCVALLLIIASRHWAKAGTRKLALLAAGGACVSLVAGLSMAFLMTPTAPPKPVQPAASTETARSKPSCVMTGSGNTVINTGTGVAAAQVCGDAQ